MDKGASLQEEWRAVPGYEGLYEVSDHGRVRSLRKGQIMSPGSGMDGYPIISLYGPGGRKGIAVHRLVAEVFVPGRNELHKEAAHLDGDRSNPRADNLKWVSKTENHFHMRAHGTHIAGEKNGYAKLSEVEARLILQAKDSTPANVVAAQYGISKYTVHDIWRGKRWRHLHRHGLEGDSPASAVAESDAPEPHADTGD